jgi:membrane protein
LNIVFYIFVAFGARFCICVAVNPLLFFANQTYRSFMRYDLRSQKKTDGILILRKIRWLYKVIKNAISGVILHDGVTVASSLSFSLTLSIFPFLILVLILASALGGDSFAQNLESDLFRVLPPYVSDIIRPQLDRVLEARATGGLFTVGILVLLFSISGLVETVRYALAIAYGYDETRSFFYRRVTGLGVVFIVVAGLILTTLLGVILPLLWRFALPYLPNVPLFLNYDPLIETARLVILAIALGAILFVLHITLPPRHKSFKIVAPGILLTLIFWWVSANAFALYLEHFGTFAATYAGLAGIIAVLLFFEIASLILIFGAEFNRALIDTKEKKS